jgi:hypothetical protein
MLEVNGIKESYLRNGKKKVKELEYAYSNRIVSENIAIAAFEALYADWNGIAVVDTTDVWLTIIPLDLSSKGKSACVIASWDHKLISNIFLASGRERSDIGILAEAPALLTKMSRLREDSLLAQAAIEELDCISSTSVSMPRDESCVIFERYRAVA